MVNAGVMSGSTTDSAGGSSQEFNTYEFAKRLQKEDDTTPPSVVHFKKQFRKYLHDCGWIEMKIDHTLREEYADQFFDAFLRSLKRPNSRNFKETHVDIDAMSEAFLDIFNQM
jgi:hypothetical protein